MRREHWETFPDEAGKGTLISTRGGGNEATLELWRDPRCSSREVTGMLGNFLICSKGVKEPFEVQEGRCDYLRDTAAKMDLISPGGENLPSFSRVAPGSSLVTMVISGSHSCGLRKAQSPCELRGASRDSSPVGAGF